MNIEHLGYILDAYQCQSVSKAAKKAYIGQSNLSNIIKNAEKEIGFALFYRTSSGIMPTPEGRVFMQHAEKILTERANIQNIPESLEKNQNLSVFSTPSSFVLQCFLDYKRDFPACSAVCDTFLEAGLRENLRGIVAQRCRLGVLIMFADKIPKYRGIAEGYGLSFEVLRENIQLVALMSQHHPLAKREHLLLEDINQQHLIIDANVDYDDALEQINKQSQQNILYVCDRSTSFDAVRKGGYISIGINLAMGDAAVLGCVCRPIEDGGRLAFCYVRPEPFHLSDREKQFVAYLSKRIDAWFGH